MVNAEKLTIYKASAGSGKTFQLTREYLTILFKNPSAYKNILAVTFTNKATAEMKGRILNELSKIANHQPSLYLKGLEQALGTQKEALIDKAKIILNNILHDYSRFTVETIDNFFQRVLKSFTKELHIYFNYNLELDTSKVIEEAASQMVFNSHQNRELRKWLSDFALEKISQGKAWNAKKDIISLGSELFNEQFQLTFNRINDNNNNKESLRKYIESCNKIIQNFENSLAKIGEEALQVIKNNGFTADDFTYKSKGVAGYFEKLAERKDSVPNSYVIKASLDFENWIPKKSPHKDQILQLYLDSLCHLLDSALQFQEKNYEKYASAKELLKLIHAFGILTDLYSQIRELTNEQNIFLLADTGKLINTIIENNDAPFIYEKLGNIYSHFMIDEFQDTSEMQWKNFFPLIENSLAQGKKNIVVGDVKQAIYRWRNSNWNILGSRIYNEVPGEQLEVVNLDKNWRSLKNIVHFNNSLYNSILQDLQNTFNSDVEGFLEANPFSSTIKNAYSELKQELPEGKVDEEGYVNVKFVNDNEWEEQILNELPELIIELLNQGFAQSEIAFLVRNKREGQLVIDKLLENSQKIANKTGIFPNFLSSDALLLKSSKSAKCIISALKHTVAPDDEVNRAYLIMLVNELVRKKNTSLHAESDEIPELILWLEQKSELHNQYSLYGLVLKIIKNFKLEELNEKAFLVTFLDTVLDFSRNQHIGTKAFLDWWDEKEDSLSLNMEEAENAIQVLTIHKSKGLEFDAVIIPFCSWRIDQHVSHANIMWCRPSSEPFNAVPVVPLTYSKGLSKTTFKNEFAFEKLNTYIDNINLFYVATTRAKRALFVRTPHPEQIKRKGLTCSNLLLNALSGEFKNDDSNYLPLVNFYSSEDFSFEVGNLIKDDRATADLHESLDVTFSESTIELNEKLRIKYNHKELLGEDVTPSFINEGKLLHKIFEKIIYSDDVSDAVEKVFMEGLITLEEKKRFNQTVSKLISSEEAKVFFDRKWKVKTETEILLPGAVQKRPDRILLGKNKVIVVDYKFGLRQSNKHNKQVEEYVQLLKNMNYSNVEGFVWYVALNLITRVN